MQRIIVAVDGSDASARALDMAADLAKFYGAKVTAVNVVIPLVVPPDIAYQTGELEAANRRHGQKVAREAAETLAAKGLQAEGQSYLGSPADVIVQAADEADVGLVIVGSRGNGPVKRVLLGSVSDRIVHLCKKPVLVVH